MLRILARVALIPTLLIVGTISLSLLSTSVVRGAINNQISFQGKLTNPDGTNVTNGNYSIAFTIYSGGTVNGGGSSVWTETQNPVAVTDGIFQVNLGSVTMLPGSVDFNTSNLFLAVKVGADPEMLPRITFTASPYAFNSDKLGGIAASGFVQLSPGAQQTGFINISGNTTVGGTYNGNTFTSSALTFSAASNAAIQSASSQAMNITGNAASTYSTSVGNLTLQAGSGTVSLGTSTALTATGTLAISSGAATALTIDSGTTGALNIGTGANAKTITLGNTTGATAIATLVGVGTNTFSIQGASSVIYLQLNSTSERLNVGNPAGEAGTSIVLLILNNKTDAGDPTNGVNGAQYYSVTDGKNRCYENGTWSDCSALRLAGETTLGVANGTISITLNGNYEYLECRVDVKGRSVANIVYTRFNNDAGLAAYGWNAYGIVAAAVTDWQDATDSEIQLSGTQTGTNPFSADLKITNYADTNKVVDWSAAGVEAVATNSNRYSGVGGYYNVASQITSVQFITSAGTFNTGSHAWCQGKNVR